MKISEPFNIRFIENCFRQWVGRTISDTKYGRENDSMFLENKWNSFTAARYSERMVILTHSVVSHTPKLLIMQDNAPPHKATQTN